MDKGAWIYSWDTRLVPNGEYVVIAEVENEYGLYTQQSNSIKVFNQQKTALTEDEELKIAVLSKLGEEIEEAEEETASTEDADLEVASEDEQKLGAEVLAVVNEEEAFNDLINSFKAELEEDLQRLASALRMNNSDDIERAEKRLETLRDTIIQSDLSDNDRERLIERIDIYIEAAIERIESNVQKTNQLIAERTAEKVVTDSDDDGISDFDEVNLYNTNPFSADTDNDGFTDGAEILSGYNPNDASAEALVAYESPKENGIVREDILVVDSVITATKNDTDEEERPSAIISGKALPNSFVTLYVFSTPIVVTVKTDADGSWNYRFDKEIEDGEHQVYIGVTDNAGKLVAKSNPFTFIKQAEAFTGANAAANAETVPAPVGEKTLIGEYMIYLVLSISVVAIGLLLILLGLHLDARPRKLLAAQEGTQAVV